MTECGAVQHMDDPWYMVFCKREAGHRGRHRHEWTDKDDGAQPAKVVKNCRACHHFHTGECVVCGCAPCAQEACLEPHPKGSPHRFSNQAEQMKSPGPIGSGATALGGEE